MWCVTYFVIRNIWHQKALKRKIKLVQHHLSWVLFWFLCIHLENTAYYCHAIIPKSNWVAVHRIYCVIQRKQDWLSTKIQSQLKFQTTERFRLYKISPSKENTVVTFNEYVFILKYTDIRQNPLNSYVRSYSVVKDSCFEINKLLKCVLKETHHNLVNPFRIFW